MSNEYFRVLKGVEIDGKVRIMHGSGIPGTTPETNSATISSIYLEDTSGDLFIKFINGSGSPTWRLATSISPAQLQSENPSSYATPTAQGVNSTAIGSGAQTLTSAPDSIALGPQSVARNSGIVQSNGRFSGSGDAQAGSYLLRGISVNSMETELFLDGTGLGGGTQRLLLVDDSTWTFKATITGHRTDSSDGHAGYTIEGVIYKMSGANTISFVGKPTITVIAESNRQWDVNVYADTTNGSLKITTTGQVGKQIRWLAQVTTVEITN